MKKLVLLAFMAGSLASAPASAGDRLSPGGAAALGVLGGLAVGAAIGANAQPLPPPPPPPVYVERAPKRVYVETAPKRVYVERAPRRVYVEEPAETCVVERERVWVPGWGWEMRRRTVCD
jgi:hypothetical protein